jgi:hypothetical protein
MDRDGENGHFVGVRNEMEPMGSGTVSTPRFYFSARDLFVNSRGPVKIEVLLEGREGAIATTEISGDSYSHRVRFNGKPLRFLRDHLGFDPKHASGRTITLSNNRGWPEATTAVGLRFTVGNGGYLYAFSVDTH